MRFFRKERVGSVIQRELSVIINHEFEFDGALVTITDVAVSGDLQDAVVKISVLPPEKTPTVWKTLQRFQPRLQNILLKKMNIKPMPRIRFEIEGSL